MTMTQQRSTNRYIERPAPSSLADVVDTILDKGLVIDAYIRVSLVGIELLTIDARIVVASVDTYLRFAHAVNRLDLTETETSGIPELMEDITSSGSKGKTSGALEGAKEKVTDLLSGDEDGDEDGEEKSDDGNRSKQRARPKESQGAQRRGSGFREKRTEEG